MLQLEMLRTKFATSHDIHLVQDLVWKRIYSIVDTSRSYSQKCNRTLSMYIMNYMNNGD